MTTVILQADEAILARAQEVITQQQMTLDEFFENALREVANRSERMRRFDDAMQKLRKFRTGGPYTRDELNER